MRGMTAAARRATASRSSLWRRMAIRSNASRRREAVLIGRGRAGLGRSISGMPARRLRGPSPPRRRGRAPPRRPRLPRRGSGRDERPLRDHRGAAHARRSILITASQPFGPSGVGSSRTPPRRSPPQAGSSITRRPLDLDVESRRRSVLNRQRGPGRPPRATTKSAGASPKAMQALIPTVAPQGWASATARAEAGRSRQACHPGVETPGAGAIVRKRVHGPGLAPVEGDPLGGARRSRARPAPPPSPGRRAPDALAASPLRARGAGAPTPRAPRPSGRRLGGRHRARPGQHPAGDGHRRRLGLARELPGPACETHTLDHPTPDLTRTGRPRPGGLRHPLKELRDVRPRGASPFRPLEAAAR